MIRGIRIVFFFFPFLWGCASAYPANDMELGFYRYSDSMTEQQRNLVWDLEDAAASKGKDEFRSIQAFVGMEEPSTLAVLSNQLDLGVINLVSGAVIGSWPLTRWEGDYIEEEVLNTFYHGRQWPGTQGFYGDLTGCLAKSPLRFGDFSGNGAAEIVVFLPDEFTLDMLVFSPAQGKVIFSHPVATTNSIAEGDADQSLLHPDASLRSQYYVRSGQEIIGMGWAMKPAVRAYGKVYTGDFNENGTRDLLVWRKLFQSRLVSDQVIGFERLRETWLHYAMIDGQYQLQNTPEATIRSWLSNNNLTWQKGYPSKSECPGEEGQLIPEMHDPLLNDPDVLQ